MTFSHTNAPVEVSVWQVGIPLLSGFVDVCDTANIRKYCLLKALLSTVSTGWYDYGLTLEVAKKRILEAWSFTRQTSTDEENSKEDWAVVLESWNRSKKLAARFQGIPSWVCWYYQFPRRRLEGPRGLVFSPDVGGGCS